MWETIKELKENDFFKKRLLEIKGKYDKFFSQTALTAMQFNKKNNQNFAAEKDTNKYLSKQKRRKLNHDNLYYNSQKRNYFNVYKNNFAIYFDQANFKSIHKYYSKINEKKNLKKIIIDLIKKRINQKLYSIVIDRHNSPEKAQHQSSPKMLNNNVSIISQVETKKRDVFHRLKNEFEKNKENSPGEKNYNIIKKTYAKNNKGEKAYKENIIKKKNYPFTNSEKFKNDEFIFKPTIIKECDDFITKTLMDKMHEFKFTFTENLSNRLNIKEALKKLKFIDKKNNYNDFADEIYSTDNIINNYNKNKLNIKIVKPDKFSELKKKKTDFYQNIVDNRRALLVTPSNYYVRLERNKLGVKIGKGLIFCLVFVLSLKNRFDF